MIHCPLIDTNSMPNSLFLCAITVFIIIIIIFLVATYPIFSIVEFFLEYYHISTKISERAICAVNSEIHVIKYFRKNCYSTFLDVFISLRN